MWALLSLSAALGLLPQLPVDPIIIASTNPATFTLHTFYLDPVPGATAYRIYVIPISQVRPVNVATNFLTTSTANTITHLLYGQGYWIQAQTLTATDQSDLSEPLEWPQPLTNFGLHTYQQSSDLVNWESVGPVSVVTNPAGYFRISQTITNNRDAFQSRE